MTVGRNGPGPGPGASGRSSFVAMQADEMHRALDPMAAHISRLGIAPVLGYTKGNLTMCLPTLPDADAGLPDGTAARTLLLKAQEEAAVIGRGGDRRGADGRPAGGASRAYPCAPP